MKKHRNLIRIFAFAVLIMLCCSRPYAGEEKKLSFVVGTHASSSVTDVYFDFLKIAFAELGYTLTLEKAPMERAYQYVDTGRADGMVMVPEGLEKKYKNIALIPEPLTTINVIAMTSGRQIKIDGIKSIKDYTVGIIRGYAIAEKLTAQMKRHIVNDHDSLLSMLELGRIDIAIAMRRETLRFIEKNPKYKGIVMLDPPLYSVKLFPCLNRKHDRLVTQATPVIKRLLDEKVLEKLYKPYDVQKN